LSLALKALDKNRLHVLIMPEEGVTLKEDIEDAIELCEVNNLSYNIIYINKIKQTFLEFVEKYKDIKVAGNLGPRIRMTILYYYANNRNLLVLGTGDKSELLIGYFTKYGDGGVDLLPIGDLYKTQVRQLGNYLGLPQRIVKKPSSPRLWPGHIAENEIGLSYETLDKILHAIFDLNMKDEEIAYNLNVPLNVIQYVKEKVEKSEHKRKGPIICYI
jgi:NAD+ synthase